MVCFPANIIKIFEAVKECSAPLLPVTRGLAKAGWKKTNLELRRKGEVEVFDLDGHPKAKRAYAWSHREGQDDNGERFVTVLEIPPVDSAVTAVRASIVSDGKRRAKKTA